MDAQSIHVLLIEDNPADAELVQEYLAASDALSFDMACADRLAAGIARLSRGGIDVVLLDLSLPDSQGLDTLDRVLAHAPTVPVVILTGLQQDALGLEAIRRGAQDYLIKGQLNGPLIARTIRYGLERARVREQLQQRDDHLRILCGQLPAILWTTDRELCFTSSVGAGLHDLRLEPGQVVGRRLADYFQTSDPDFPPILAHKRALEGESTSCEIDWLDQSFHVRVEPLRQGNHVVGTIGVALNVTEHRRVTESLRLARQIQQRLLPRTKPALAEFDFGGCALFAEATGGDFYDFIPQSDGSLCIAIGDVSGHDFGSALLAAAVHAALRTLALTGLQIDLGSMLSTSNRLLCAGSADDRFVTLLVARIDPLTRMLTYSNAGHPSGVILDPAGRIKAELSSMGLMLGVLPDERYPTPPAIALESGDLVLFVTDGVLEAMSPKDVLYGTGRPIEILREIRQESAQTIAERVCAAAIRFSEGVPQIDDVTAVVIKVEAARDDWGAMAAAIKNVIVP